MNKELTPLEALKEVRDTRVNVSPYGFYDYDEYGDKLCDIIETALKDYEWLKSKISIDWFDKLQTDDKFRVMKIMGVEYDETYTK